MPANKRPNSESSEEYRQLDNMKKEKYATFAYLASYTSVPFLIASLFYTLIRLAGGLYPSSDYPGPQSACGVTAYNYTSNPNTIDVNGQFCNLTGTKYTPEYLKERGIKFNTSGVIDNKLGLCIQAACSGGFVILCLLVLFGSYLYLSRSHKSSQRERSTDDSIKKPSVQESEQPRTSRTYGTVNNEENVTGTDQTSNVPEQAPLVLNSFTLEWLKRPTADTTTKQPLIKTGDETPRSSLDSSV